MTSENEFEGRTILVSSAGGGIGGATVRHLAAKGADVIAAGRSVQSLKRSPPRRAPGRSLST